MRRILSFTVFLLTLLLVFQFFVIRVSTGHEIDYEFHSGENSYKITERLSLREKKPVYQIKVTYKENTVIFENDQDYNKKKKIITAIRSFEEQGITCLSPVYQERIEDAHDIQCVVNNEQYTYTALKDRYPFLSAFETNLTQGGTILPSWTPPASEVQMNDIFVNQNDIPENIYIGIWRYQGLQIASREKKAYTFLLHEDSYQEKGVLAGQYYVIPNYSSNPEFNSIFLADVVNFGSQELSLDTIISKDCYFNGVVDNKAYLFDRKNKKQYEINPETKNIREIGNVEINAQFYDGEKWSDRNIYDFTTEKILFEKDTSKMTEVQKYHPTSIVETSDCYYFTAGSGIYQLWKNELNHPIQLVSMTNIKELKVVDGKLFFISKNALYVYHDTIGLRKLASNNEFLYNDQLYVVYEE